jgi:hypothetical protein
VTSATIATDSVGLAKEAGGHLASIDTNTTGAAKDATLATIDADLKTAEPRRIQDSNGNPITTTAGAINAQLQNTAVPIANSTIIGKTQINVNSSGGIAQLPANLDGSGNLKVAGPVTQGTVAAVTATWNNATAQDTTIPIATSGYPSVIVTNTVSGSITGGTLNFETSDDNGTTWRAGFCTRLDLIASSSNTQLAQTSFTSFCTAGATNTRMRLNPVITGTGSIAPRIQASAASVTPYSNVFVNNTTLSTSDTATAATNGSTASRAIQIGGSDGTNLKVPTVKATPPTTSDNAIVTSLSPNSAIIQVINVSAPPILTQAQMANPLLFSAAMQQFCRTNLCPILGK